LQKSPFDRAVSFKRCAVLLVGATALGALVRCTEGGSDRAGSAGAPEQPAAVADRARPVLARIRAAIPGALVEPAAAASATAKAASVELPARATGAVRVRDERTQIELHFSLEGASPEPRSESSGIAVYAGAAPSGGDVIDRVSPAGVEDLVFFEREPAERSLRYRVTPGGAGLRLVAGTLEVLDRDGLPALRVAPPFVLDAAGHRAAAALSVEGCAVSTSSLPPLGERVLPAGAPTCTVKVSWEGAALRYPILVDPQWTATTTGMTAARTRLSLTVLDPQSLTSPVLVAGGFDGGGNALASAEIYYPASRVFAAIPPMIAGRGDHTATLFTLGAVSRVLLAGGRGDWSGGTPLSSTEIFDPAAGTFTAGPPMAAARFNHTSTLLDNGKVLVAGGTTMGGLATKAFTIYTPSAGGGSFSPEDVDTMAAPRSSHTASKLTHGPNQGKVLIAGGVQSAGYAQQSAELFDPGTNKFSSAGGNMKYNRAFHTATVLGNGDVLIAGGGNGAAAGDLTWATTEIYAESTGLFGEVGPMSEKRARHTATLMATGEVLITGGQGDAPASATAEIYQPAKKSWKPPDPSMSTPMSTPRRDHRAELVGSGVAGNAGQAVLVAGGVSPGVVLATAEILVQDLGGECAQDAECASGHCSGKVCCDTACNEPCRSCTAIGKGTGNNGTCGNAKAGTDLGWTCSADKNLVESEAHQGCDANGNVVLLTPPNQCTPNKCDAMGYRCETHCPCSVLGFCSDAGVDASGAGGAASASSSASTSSSTASASATSTGTGGAGGASTGAGGAGGASASTTGAGGAASTSAATGSGGGGGAGSGLHCEKRRDDSQACTFTDQCLMKHFCVDGVCCNAECKGRCQACDVKNKLGVCTNVGIDAPEAPHPNDSSSSSSKRDACAGTGTNCSGFCDGKSASACSYPGSEKQLKDPSCAAAGDGYATTKYLCDGKGSKTESTASCEGFLCDGATACKAICASDGDCIADWVCNDQKICEKLTGPRCDGQHTIKAPGQMITECPLYNCDRTTNACKTSCASIDDCVAPNVCSSGKCGPAPTAPELSSCSASPARPAGSGGAAWAGVALAIALALRSKRRRES
jgi:hypothetical protein